MYTFVIQLIDLLARGQVGLFLVFFIVTWALYITKLIKSAKTPKIKVDRNIQLSEYPSITVIIPVVDEPMHVWEHTLTNVKDSIYGLKAQVLVVANGGNGKKEGAYAKKLGFDVISIEQASKRRAIAAASSISNGEVTIILDSDTITTRDAMRTLLQAFEDKRVGGATPRHVIDMWFAENISSKRNIWRRIADWLEDIRFEEVLKGQNGAVGCLPGRLLAIRTKLLHKYIDGLVGQRFLGKPCISGDDRYLTSRLLEDGFKTVYVEDSMVITQAPDTLKGFVQQRLRWSRTSLRETILSLNWIFRYPYLALTTLANVIMRWFFFVVVVTAILAWVGIIDRPHVVNLSFEVVVLGTIIGYIMSGFFRHLRHLLNKPQDIVLLPVFLFVTTFILTPVEWFGNLTLIESGWMTRDTK